MLKRKSKSPTKSRGRQRSPKRTSTAKSARGARLYRRKSLLKERKKREKQKAYVTSMEPTLRYLPRRRSVKKEKGAAFERYYNQSCVILHSQLGIALHGRVRIGTSTFDLVYEMTPNHFHEGEWSIAALGVYPGSILDQSRESVKTLGAREEEDAAQARFTFLNVLVWNKRRGPQKAGTHAFSMIADQERQSISYYNTGGNRDRDTMAAKHIAETYFPSFSYVDCGASNIQHVRDEIDTVPRGVKRSDYPTDSDTSCQSWVYVWPLLVVGCGLYLKEATTLVKGLDYADRWALVDATREYLSTYDERSSPDPMEYLAPFITSRIVEDRKEKIRGQLREALLDRTRTEDRVYLHTWLDML